MLYLNCELSARDKSVNAIASGANCAATACAMCRASKLLILDCRVIINVQLCVSLLGLQRDHFCANCLHSASTESA